MLRILRATSLILGQNARIRRAEIVRREALRATELDPGHDGAKHGP